ncbi:hypothetical protein NliqN6_1068 [Naganishia liquefaciens]|uniref:Uncharacterized protein n=1 Tax=Naganishia liquefaciens TaxID=104408 RepID=A0A8H3TPQ7_9TREE|nr:hypothetical protein NliqN6_1068 [Naganishia liquefaciens]
MNPTKVMAKLDDGTSTEEELEPGPLGDLLRTAWRVVTGMPWFEALYGLPCSHFGVRVTHHPVRDSEDRLAAFETDVEIAITTDPEIDLPKLRLGKKLIKKAYEDLLRKRLLRYETQCIRSAPRRQKPNSRNASS